MFFLTLAFYTIFYVFYLAGYLTKETEQKTILTKEAIERFENDIEQGKDVTIKDYLTYNKKDYKTKISIVGNKIAGSIEYLMEEGIENAVLVIEKLFS